MDNNNIRIARELVRLARMIAAGQYGPIQRNPLDTMLFGRGAVEYGRATGNPTDCSKPFSISQTRNGCTFKVSGTVSVKQDMDGRYVPSVTIDDFDETLSDRLGHDTASAADFMEEWGGSNTVSGTACGTISDAAQWIEATVQLASDIAAKCAGADEAMEDEFRSRKDDDWDAWDDFDSP